MIFEIKFISKCTLITISPKILVVEHWFHHAQLHDHPWEQNVSITFQVKGQVQKATELKPLSERLIQKATELKPLSERLCIVGSSF